jgi:hypothetical protein
MRRRPHASIIALTLALLIAPSRTLSGALKGTCALRASGTAHAPGTVVWLEQVPAKVEERIVRGPNPLVLAAQAPTPAAPRTGAAERSFPAGSCGGGGRRPGAHA